MLKQLRVVTVLLLGLAGVFVVIIVRELTSPLPSLPRPRPQAAAPSGPPAVATATPAASPAAGGSGYATVVSRNLFSPTRTEAPPAPPPAPVVNLPPKPNLFGVVLQDGTPIAYLEDPTTKRVARYRVGDAVAGGTLKTIGSDSVILSRPDGQIAVRLHDPTRPRPAAPAGAPGTPTQGMQPQPVTPGARPPVFPEGMVVPPTTPMPSPPGAAPSRRPMPQGVFGRVPPQTDAPKPQ
jgi:hypothetical protein